jgi:hypothetical protein
MITSARRLLTIILSIFLLIASVKSDAARDEQLQLPSQINANDSLIPLHQLGKCPRSPKPVCSDPNCQKPRYVSPMQYQCEATTVFRLNDRDVTPTGCRCCPLPIFVWCPNHDCCAPTDTRQCASAELEGCACETTEDWR